MPVEVGVKVTLSVKRESGESESKCIPVKDFKSPHEPGSPEFWDDVLGFVRKYHLYPDTRQKTLEVGSDEAKKAAADANKSLGAKLREKKPKGKDKDAPEDTTGAPAG